MSNLMNKLSGGTGMGQQTTNNGMNGGGETILTRFARLIIALDFAEKKLGGGKELGRNTNEKITDSVRTGFEKVTGKNVPAKFSN
ncbi:hypothetical protein B0H16DRAFT_1542249 [Mycena metata]|uniref:Uncharacterized protein n=1 Tax=Mycena metata TaxID=1033252 RepID=A0AAD7J3M5_9AGAR|nr:hypothetical protein B0H16DRAFT_1542249 [Mycena metata]